MDTLPREEKRPKQSSELSRKKTMATASTFNDQILGGVTTANSIGHKDIITDLLMLPKLQYLASASLDKKVILWDTITGDLKRVYSEHTMVSRPLTLGSGHPDLQL